MTFDIGDKNSALFEGLNGFWQRFFKDTMDLQSFYQASEMYLGQVYLDLMASVLNIGVVDTPIFNKEVWKLFTIKETELNFVAGDVPQNDRYVYDMPGDIVNVSALQNTIFSPEVVLEPDVDFDVINNDGLLRLKDDPFRDITDIDGNQLPITGVAWRTLHIEVGNNMFDLKDKYTSTPVNYYGEGVRKGDTLRVLAQCRKIMEEGTTGSIAVTPSVAYIYGVDIHLCNVGDVIYIHAHGGGPGDEDYLGYYIVKNVSGGFPNRVEVDTSTLRFPGLGSSASALSWKLYRAVYEEAFRDFEVDYINETEHTLVGAADNPYPLDTEGFLVYSVVRNPAEPNVSGVSLTFSTVDPVTVPIATDLGQKNIVVGSVSVVAYKYPIQPSDPSVPVEEGVDYKVDYLNGVLYQLRAWRDSSAGRCNYSFMDEVIYSGGGTVAEQATGKVKQLSFWVPEVEVDRFTLWYNYGTLLNRFGASSEAYKTFLRGIMHLYASGPVLERIEAALNVAAGFPIVKTDGEILASYYNGIDASGAAAELVSSTDTVNIPTIEHMLTELDVGGYLVINAALNANNIGRFRILDIDIPNNTAILETQYGFTDEIGISWVISREYVKRVVTDRRTYTFPYYVPMRDDVQLSSNIDVLSFESFEALTVGFTVTDYVEDPNWWHNKHIPDVLWSSGSASRRLASTKLYEHVIGAEDLPLIGDPGLYIGAGEDGVVFTPNDNSVSPGVGEPVPLYRHKVAFTLFDQFFKCHMFFIDISPDLELDSQFKTDLEELILVAKPSYTYPYVEPSEVFVDNMQLTDVLDFSGITFEFGGEADGKLDSFHMANNELVIGDPYFPFNVGDFYRYGFSSGISIPGAPPGAPTLGVSFLLSLAADVRPLSMNFNGTVSGEPVLEGRDYTVNWLLEDPVGTPNPSVWEITLLTTWDGGSFPTMDLRFAVFIPSSSYDTTLGDTPLCVAGLNPAYVRSAGLNPNAPTYLAEWAAVRTEKVDRPLQLTIVDGGGSYTYP